MDADRREWSLEVQRGLLVRCDELHRSAKLVRFTAGLTQQDAAEVRTHSAEVRAAVALARSQRGTPVVRAFRPRLSDLAGPASQCLPSIHAMEESLDVRSRHGDDHSSGRGGGARAGQAAA